MSHLKTEAKSIPQNLVFQVIARSGLPGEVLHQQSRLRQENYENAPDFALHMSRLSLFLWVWNFIFTRQRTAHALVPER
jgi:hypothetical protein